MNSTPRNYRCSISKSDFSLLSSSFCRTSGFTLVEILVVAACFSLIMFGLIRFFTAGQRGSRLGLEVVNQTSVAALLLEHLETDFTGLLPFPASTTAGGLVGAPLQSSSAQGTRDYLFWTTAYGGFKPVRYSYNPASREVCRYEGTPGVDEQKTHYGRGVFTDFSLQPLGAVSGCYKATLSFKGKLANKTFIRFLSSGITPVASVAKYWLFSPQ